MFSGADGSLKHKMYQLLFRDGNLVTPHKLCSSRKCSSFIKKSGGTMKSFAIHSSIPQYHSSKSLELLRNGK